MFEKEIKFIGEFSLSRVKKLGSDVTFDKLADAGLHPAITSYISAELDYMIHRDRQKLLSDSIFDYSGKEVSEHFKVISKEIKQNKKISTEDISKLIFQAVSFSANYVVRPKWSLTKFIYNDQNFISVEELDLMLNYLYYYDYIKNVLTAYISKRKVVQLTLTEFDLILNKIDRELFKSNSEELINNALHSISDFFSVGNVDKNRIALTSVEILLKEKNLMDYLLRLRRTIPAVTRKKYELSDIKKILYATKLLKPGSIQGYNPGKMELVEESKVEPVVEKMVEDLDTDDSEIIQEEEIISPPEKDEEISFDELNQDPEKFLVPEPDSKPEPEPDPVIDTYESEIEEPEIENPKEEEKEELLPIEEEFLNEFKVEDTPEPEPLIDDSPEKFSVEDEIRKSVFDELEDDLNELIERNTEDISTSEEEPENLPELNESKPEDVSEPETEASDEDDLLVFYENELAMMDDDDTDLVIVSEEGVKEPEENITGELPASLKEEFNIDEEPDALPEDEKTSVEEDIFSGEDFDLSIFDDDEPKPEPELVSEMEEEEIKESEIEDLNEEEQEEPKPGLPVENEIINEMLEDYFRDDKKEELPKSKSESFKLADDEFELEQDDDFERQFNANLLNDPSLEKHIANVLDEFDDLLLEEETSGPTDEKKEEPRKEVPKKENKTTSALKDQPVNELDEEIDIEKDLFGEEIEIEKKSTVNKKPEQKKKIKSPVPKTEAPDRDKDFFSYLNKKEMKKIVSTVFGGDDGDFVTTIEKISECSSYKEATEILKGVFFSYRVSPYSKEAVLLTNAVSNFFRQT